METNVIFYDLAIKTLQIAIAIGFCLVSWTFYLWLTTPEDENEKKMNLQH